MGEECSHLALHTRGGGYNRMRIRGLIFWGAVGIALLSTLAYGQLIKARQIRKGTAGYVLTSTADPDSVAYWAPAGGTIPDSAKASHRTWWMMLSPTDSWDITRLRDTLATLASMVDSLRDAKRAEVSDTTRSKGQNAKVYTQKDSVKVEGRFLVDNNFASRGWATINNKAFPGFIAGDNRAGIILGSRNDNWGFFMGCVRDSDMADNRWGWWLDNINRWVFYVDASGKWLIGPTTSTSPAMLPDSQLTVYGGFHASGGIRSDVKVEAPACSTARLSADHGVLWGGYTGTGWDSTWHRWGKRDSVDSLRATKVIQSKLYRGDSAATDLNDTCFALADSTNEPLITLKNVSTGTEAVCIMASAKIEAIDVSSTTRSAIIGRTSSSDYGGTDGQNTGNGPGIKGEAQGSGPGVHGTSANGVGVWGFGNPALKGECKADSGWVIYNSGYRAHGDSGGNLFVRNLISDTAHGGQKGGLVAADTLLGNAFQVINSYFDTLATSPVLVDDFCFPCPDSTVVDSFCAFARTPPSGFSSSSDTLKYIWPSDSILITWVTTGMGMGIATVTWSGHKAVAKGKWVKLYARRGDADTHFRDINAHLFYYPKPHRPGGGWKGLAMLSPVIGYGLLATALLGAAARAYVAWRRRRREEMGDTFA